MSSIHLFTGENAYALREEKRRWIDEFVKKHSVENLIRLPGQDLTFRRLLDDVTVMPFLAERRLVIVEGLPPFSKEEMMEIPRHLHPQVILLFVAPTVDRRLAAAKQLLTVAEVRTFAPLKGNALFAWMHALAQSLGGSLEHEAALRLVEFLGEEQDPLATEIGKLVLHAAGRPVTEEDATALTLPVFEGVAWKLTDLLAGGKRREALLFAHDHVERGGDPWGLWANLLSGLRTLVLVSVAAREGRSDVREIAAELKVHFLAVRSVLPVASRVPPEALRAFLEESVAADIGLKTGEWRATAEAPQELLALIDRFILTAPQ